MTKTAMVTGASGGIGLAFAERLAKEGYQVTLVARSEAKLKEVAAQLGAGHKVLSADLSNPSDIRRVADDVRQSKYDLLVNNAGIGIYGVFSEHPLDATQAMMRLNVDSVVELSHAFLGGAKQGDALINVSSTLAWLPMAGATVYSATKSFVTAFSEGLWFENKARGVYVAALNPGVTKTNFHVAAGGTADRKPPEAISQTSAEVVDAAMKGLKSRSSPNILTSFTNKAMVFVSTRVLSRRGRVNMMAGNSPVKSSGDALRS